MEFVANSFRLVVEIYFNVYGFILTRCVDTFVRIAPIDVVDGVPRVFYAHRYAKEIMTSSNVNS